MKNLGALIIGLIALASCANAQSNNGEFTRVVDAACGECQFDMTGESCDLAVKIDDKFYFVEGSAIHEHGDAHASNGLCSAVRQAKVTGRIKRGVFYASSFELIEE
ncbi:MAG: DUF6370 family protein [Crocinitomicaceae bacterium]|nr:DUF6370 family protein [Crocinitomicaceae bacterium]